jgi:3-deoxy-manno-octulosonate cytidylyltransferase (CMP-KDO synthetase)
MESLGHGAKFVRSVENPIKEGGIYKHIGIYSYSKSVLGSAVEYGETQLEKVNRLEQLRFIEMGLGISILLLPELPEIISVDNESDLYRVREILSRSASSRHLTEKYSVDHC